MPPLLICPFSPLLYVPAGAPCQPHGWHKCAASACSVNTDSADLWWSSFLWDGTGNRDKSSYWSRERGWFRCYSSSRRWFSGQINVPTADRTTIFLPFALANASWLIPLNLLFHSFIRVIKVREKRETSKRFLSLGRANPTPPSSGISPRRSQRARAEQRHTFKSF